MHKSLKFSFILVNKIGFANLGIAPGQAVIFKMNRIGVG